MTMTLSAAPADVAPPRPWTIDDMPDLSGRLALVTGANSGLGYVTARELARRGARVVLACRDPGRGARRSGRCGASLPGARLELRPLDLASLASIRAFAERWDAGPLDLLVNNAGIALVPRSRTEDGFEAHFGVNHLGTFALTGLHAAASAGRPVAEGRHGEQRGPALGAARSRQPRRRARLSSGLHLLALQEGQRLLRRPSAAPRGGGGRCPAQHGQRAGLCREQRADRRRQRRARPAVAFGDAGAQPLASPSRPSRGRGARSMQPRCRTCPAAATSRRTVRSNSAARRCRATPTAPPTIPIPPDGCGRSPSSGRRSPTASRIAAGGSTHGLRNRSTCAS